MREGFESCFILRVTCGMPMCDLDRSSATVASSLPRLVAIEAEGCVVLRVALFAIVTAQSGAAILIGREIKRDNHFRQPGTAAHRMGERLRGKENGHTAHLKHSGCQSLSKTLTLDALSSPSFGAMGRLQAQQRGANFLENRNGGNWRNHHCGHKLEEGPEGVVSSNPNSQGVQPIHPTHLL